MSFTLTESFSSAWSGGVFQNPSLDLSPTDESAKFRNPVSNCYKPDPSMINGVRTSFG